MKVEFLQCPSSVLSFLFIAFLIPSLAGCLAAGARAKAMVPTNVGAGQQHSHSLGLSVQGGQETNPFYESEISNEAFLEALQNAISQSGLFSKVSIGKDADYWLEILINDVDQPFLSFATTVNVKAHWKLTEVSTSRVIWQEFVASSYDVSVLSVPYGVARLRVANEGAARENIKEGIRRLSLVQF